MRRRIRVVLAVSAVAMAAIAGRVTYAVAQVGSGDVINGCYKSANGQTYDSGEMPKLALLAAT